MSEQVVIHTPEEIVRIRRAAELTAQVRDSLRDMAQVGMTTGELDRIAGRLIAATGGKAAFLGYAGFPNNICISLNEEIVHGIGTDDRVIGENDIVSIDVGVEIDGSVGDTALTFAMKDDLDRETAVLLQRTQEALMAGIKAARGGNHMRDISYAIETIARRHKLGVIRDYVGHGCGTKLHEPPEVPNFVAGGMGPLLRPGMVLAIEPMFALGTWKVAVDRKNGWTVRTRDGKNSAHFEHMVLITENEPEILTWPKTTC